MKRSNIILALTGFVLCGAAGATNLDFSVAYPLTARTGFSDFPALGGKLAAGASNRGLDVTYSRLLSLPPLGALSTSSTFRYAWAGGFRLESAASGALGPVALNLTGAYFTTSATTLDPLSAWTQEATDLRAKGWNANLGVRYRVNRQLIAQLGTELGGQWNVYGGVEKRQDITRTLPPAEGDDPAAPPETEKVGSLSYRVGARAGRDVLGVTAGVTYSTEAGRAFSLDAQLGPSRNGNSGLGLLASASFAEVLGENSVLSAYAAYEPWRGNSMPLRAGVGVTRPVGPGTLRLDVRGGQDHAGQTGFGASVGYSVMLGGTQTDQQNEP